MADDLFKALQLFRGGMQQAAQAKALQDANQKVKELRQQSRLSRKEQQDQLKLIGQDLSTQLGAFGASPASIEQQLKTLTPDPRFAQSAGQILLNQDQFDPKQVQQARELIKDEREAQIDLLKIRQDSAFERQQQRESQSRQKEQRRQLFTFQRDFNSTVKGVDKAVNQAKNAIRILDAKGPASKLAVGVIGTMMARASGEVGNLTQVEREAFAGLQSISGRIQRVIARGAFSELTPQDKAAIREVAKVYVDRGDEMLQRTAETMGTQLSVNTGGSPEDLAQKISGGRFKPQGTNKDNLSPEEQKLKDLGSGFSFTD